MTSSRSSRDSRRTPGPRCRDRHGRETDRARDDSIVLTADGSMHRSPFVTVHEHDDRIGSARCSSSMTCLPWSNATVARAGHRLRRAYEVQLDWGAPIRDAARSCPPEHDATVINDHYTFGARRRMAGLRRFRRSRTSTPPARDRRLVKRALRELGVRGLPAGTRGRVKERRAHRSAAPNIVPAIDGAARLQTSRKLRCKKRRSSPALTVIGSLIRRRGDQRWRT